MEPLRVACVGDSNTEGFRGMWSHATENNYPAVLQRLLGPAYDVVNLGSSGATMSKGGMDGGNVASYWERPQFQKLLDGGWDIVIICLGTNDSKTKASGHTTDNWFGGVPLEGADVSLHLREQLMATNPTYANSYASMVSIVRTLGNERNDGQPEIFLCVPIPVMADGAYQLSQPIINGVLPRFVPLLAQALGIPSTHVIDLFTVLGGQEIADVPADGWLEPGGPGSCKWYRDEAWGDNTHPSDAGYITMAEAIHATLIKAAGQVQAGSSGSCAVV